MVQRLILAAVLIAGLAPAFAQSPTPVPALPDTERRTSYTISASQCTCAVNFALYGDSTDYQNWVEVWLSGVGNVAFNDPTYGWTITSPSGPIGNLARPITDAVLTFNNPQTGTVQIVGARRPRRVSQFSENTGVSARNLNQVITDIVAMLREVWDKINDVTGRVIVGQPGETLPPLPPATSRAGQILCFTTPGGQPTTCPPGFAGTGTLQPGTGISLSGTNPTVISTNLTAGAGINISGSTISVTNVGSTNVKTASYTLQSSDCTKTVQISGGFFTFTLPAATGFSEGCWIILKNGDSWSGGRGKALAGAFPSDFTNGQGILWPTQAGAVKVVNGAWVTIVRPGRAKLPSGTITIFTDFANGTDTTGATDGLVNSASAFKSLQNAMYVACNEFEVNSLPQTLLTFFMAASTTDTTGVHYACPSIAGGQGGAYITVTGGTNATINTTNTDAFDVVTGATVSIFGITFAAAGEVASERPSDCLRADYGGRIFFAGGTFSVCAGSDIAAENSGNIYIQAGNYVVEGNAQRHFFAATGGVISTDYIAVTQSATLGSNVTMATAWAQAVEGGIINVPGWVALLGSFTVNGTRSGASTNGVINTNAGTTACQQTYFPGNVNGTSSNCF